MTKHEILLRLLEESRKYEYEDLFLVVDQSWMPLEMLSVRNNNPGIIPFEKQDCSKSKGVTIQLHGCAKEHLAFTQRPQAITIEQITTTFLPLSRIIFISHEI